MVGQVRRQVSAHGHRAYPRTTATVGDAEGLVQVEVADVAAEPSGFGQPHEGVEVRSVDIDLSTGRVHLVTYLSDGRLEYPVRGGIGDHQRRELIGVARDLGGQVVQVDVPFGQRLNHNHLHPRHHRAGCVGPVCTVRNQADRALVISVGTVISADRQQPGELALGSGVGLQTHRVVSGDFAHPHAQLVDQFVIAHALVGGGKRVDRGEVRPGDALHLGGAVELHRARTQRDHPPIQREILVRERAHVAQHRRFTAIPMEDRMLQVCRGAAMHRCPGHLDGLDLIGQRRRVHCKGVAHDRQMLGDGRLVGAQQDGVLVAAP